MIDFLRLQDALSYHSKCPLCQQNLTVTFSSVMPFCDTKKVTFNLVGGAKIRIDCETNHVEMIEVQRVPNKGIQYEGISIQCHACKNFSYVIQIQIDLSKFELVGIFLNSEIISIIDDNGNRISMRNIHTSQETLYTVSSLNNISSASMPLIPINFDKPKETFNRVKKLLVFS